MPQNRHDFLEVEPTPSKFTDRNTTASIRRLKPPSVEHELTLLGLHTGDQEMFIALDDDNAMQLADWLYVHHLHPKGPST